MTRGLGQTKAMVEALPASGGHIITHSFQMRDYIKRMVFDLRGPTIAAMYRFHVIRDRHDTDCLFGAKGHVSIDHAWHEKVSVDTEARVLRLTQAVDFINPKPRTPMNRDS